MLTTTRLNKIRQIVRYFETSKTSGSDYGAIAMFNDGPGGRKQLTYGSSQTTEFGGMHDLLKMYIEARGKYASEFSGYMKQLGDLKHPSLCTSPQFVGLLKVAAKDPVMQETQDRFFNIFYFNPARQWCERNGLELPLSNLVIYDSFVHSGSILDFLRQQFLELVPSKGGEEKRWVKAYVSVRDQWLENNKKPILQKTDYRTDSFLYAIEQENWLLDKPFTVVNYQQKDESDKPRVLAIVP